MVVLGLLGDVLELISLGLEIIGLDLRFLFMFLGLKLMGLILFSGLFGLNVWFGIGCSMLVLGLGLVSMLLVIV